MLISYRWLGRHVDLGGISPEQVAEDLTLSTAEVEGLERFCPVLADVVVGYVQTREQHPNAEKLSVCTVDVGEAESLQIVCGAGNVGAGQKVAVARVGTRLPGDVKLKKTKIRGLESQGMICSERELALGDEHEGIWVLAAEAEVGRPVDEALGAEDWVIEIDNKSITHRPDLWGQRGFAAELAAIYRRELKPLEVSLPAPSAGASYPVRIDSAACPRYLALAIDGVRNERSPDWLRMLLLACGQRPIDLLVDVSNFVMLDLGQPNHLFDRTRLSPEGIVVRAARPGEKMATLDEVERRLEPTDLLICSGDEPVALAGVMGGEGSKVSPGTSELLLEVAAFQAGVVRKTAARLGLRTDASARFEKSLDPTLVPVAAAGVVSLLSEIQPGLTLAGPPTDVGAWSDPSCNVVLRPERARSVLGAPIPDADIEDFLTRLGFGVEPGPGGLNVRVPSIRATRDVTAEHDLIEEIGRLWRYDNIPEQEMVATIAPPPVDARRALVRRIADRLAQAAHYHEALGYSFLPDDLARKLGVADEPYVRVTNPVIEGWQRVRRSIAASLLGLLENNLRRREEVRLFEIGKAYRPEEGGLEPREVHELAIVLAVRRGAHPRWDRTVFLRLKSVLQDLLEHVSRPAVRWESEPDAQRAAWAHPVCRARVAVSARDDGLHWVGSVCELDPVVERALGLDADVAVARLSIDDLLAAAGERRPFRAVPRYPGVKVDVALALPRDVTAARGEEAIAKAGKGLVAATELFDLYTGEAVGSGRKSMAWHVLLQSEARTLTDKDGQKFLDRLQRLAVELGGELRRE